MSPFELFRTYIALRAHFNTDYDFVKHRGAVRASYETFEKRKDKEYMTKLAQYFTKEKLIDFMVANFVAGDQWGGLFDSEAGERYKEWKARMQKLFIVFIRDLDTISIEIEKKKFHSPFDIDNTHPVILKLYLGGRINIETLTIINKIDPFIEKFDKLLELDIAWPGVRQLIIKYTPFVRIKEVKSQYEREYFNRLDELK